MTSIGDRVFSGCSGFTGDLIIPNKVTLIEVGAFVRCKGFTGDLIIPNAVTSIGADAFSSCTGLNGNIIIPTSVTSIDQWAFANCNGFLDFVVGWTMPLFVNKNIFMDVNISTKTLHVPKGTKAFYQNARVWQDFGTIVDDAHLFISP